MLRSLRKAAITLGIKKDVDEDAGAKKRMDDLKHAHDTLKKQVAAYAKSATEAGTQLAALHEAMGDIYPAEKSMSVQVLSIAGRSSAFREAAAEAAAGHKGAVEEGLAAFLAKRNEVAKMVDDRAQCRQEIMHYQEKITQIEAKGTANPKDVQKLAENKGKLEEFQTKFNDLDAALVPELEKLDGALSELLNASFQGFLDKQVALLRSQVDQYVEAVSGVPAPQPVEGRAEGSAEAAPVAAAAPVAEA